MKKILIVVAVLLIPQPAHALFDDYMEKHPVHNFVTYPVNHPLKLMKKTYNGVRHPTASLQTATAWTLERGKWMEESGFNGLMGGLGSAANIGTTTLVGAKNFGK